MKKLLIAILLIGLIVLPVSTEEKKEITVDNCVKQLTKFTETSPVALFCIDNLKFMMFPTGALVMMIKYVDGKEQSITCDCRDRI